MPKNNVSFVKNFQRNGWDSQKSIQPKSTFFGTPNKNKKLKLRKQLIFVSNMLLES